jgi:hypothetical protein
MPVGWGRIAEWLKSPELCANVPRVNHVKTGINVSSADKIYDEIVCLSTQSNVNFVNNHIFCFVLDWKALDVIRLLFFVRLSRVDTLRQFCKYINLFNLITSKYSYIENWEFASTGFKLCENPEFHQKCNIRFLQITILTIKFVELIKER